MGGGSLLDGKPFPKKVVLLPEQSQKLFVLFLYAAQGRHNKLRREVVRHSLHHPTAEGPRQLREAPTSLAWHAAQNGHRTPNQERHQQQLSDPGTSSPWQGSPVSRHRPQIVPVRGL